jgi:hypothetical protein
MPKNHLVLFQLWHCAATLEDQVLTHLLLVHPAYAGFLLRKRFRARTVTAATSNR